jgi:uncharacterized membrane protein
MGTAMLCLIAILFGPRTTLIAGAIGMGLFDLISGWTLWAPFTIVARGLQGYIVERIAWSSRYEGDNPGLNIFAMIVSAPVMLAVYYVCEGILYSNWVAPAASIPGNITQNVVGILVAIPVGIALNKTRFFRTFR